MTASRKPRSTLTPWRLRAAILIVLLAAALGWWMLPTQTLGLDEGVEGLARHIRAWGAWGVAASIALMTAHSFLPFPAEIVTLANGLVYGPVWGTVVSWVGAMFGAVAAFAVGRALGRPFVERMIRPADLARLTEWSRGQSAPALLVARLIPLIAFNLINYAAAVARVPWWTFLWTTGVGILPMTILLCVAGDRMLDAPLWAWVAAALTTIAVWYGARLIARRWKAARWRGRA